MAGSLFLEEAQTTQLGVSRRPKAHRLCGTDVFSSGLSTRRRTCGAQCRATRSRPPLLSRARLPTAAAGPTTAPLRGRWSCLALGASVATPTKLGLFSSLALLGCFGTGPGGGAATDNSVEHRRTWPLEFYAAAGGPAKQHADSHLVLSARQLLLVFAATGLCFHSDFFLYLVRDMRHDCPMEVVVICPRAGRHLDFKRPSMVHDLICVYKSLIVSLQVFVHDLCKLFAHGSYHYSQLFGNSQQHDATHNGHFPRVYTFDVAHPNVCVSVLLARVGEHSKCQTERCKVSILY